MRWGLWQICLPCLPLPAACTTGVPRGRHVPGLRGNTMWKYYALLSALFAALTAIFSKLGVRGVDAGLATAIRVSFILFLVWGIALFDGSARGIRAIPGGTWLFLLLSAAATGLSWLFYFKALETGDVSRVAPIDKLSVPLTILLAFLLLGESLSWKVVLGGALITLGTIVLAL